MEQVEEQKGEKGKRRGNPGWIPGGDSPNPAGRKGKPREPYVEPSEELMWPGDLRNMLRVARTPQCQDETADHGMWRELLKADRKAFMVKMLEMKREWLEKVEAQKRRAAEGEGVVDDGGWQRGREALVLALKELEGVR